MRGTGIVRGWKTDHQEAALGQLGGLREDLGEAEVGLEAAGRQVALIMELTSVGHPLIDQDQARAILVEKLAQDVSGTGRVAVIGLDAAEGLFAPELPG
jgi:hypothetical protein